MLVGRRRVPEDLRDVPGTVRVVDQQPVAFGGERAVDADERFRRRALQERACLLVERSAEKVVRRRVADVETDRRIEGDHLDEIGGAE